MNDTLMTVGAIFLAAVLMFIFPLMSTADRTDDVSQQVVKAKTQEFVDNIRSTGKITSDKYDSFVKSSLELQEILIMLTCKYKYWMNQQSKKTTTAASTKVGENYYYKEI